MNTRRLVLLTVGSLAWSGLLPDHAVEAAAPSDLAVKNRLVDRVNEGQTVPSPLTFTSQFQRVVLVRMTFGTDMLDALNKAVQQEQIKNAVILSGIGSLTSYHVHVVANTTFPSKNRFLKAEGPYDLTCVNGYVVDGRVHAHITFSDDKIALAGHLEPDTKVFTFAIVTIGVFGDEVDLTRLDDKEWR